MVYVVTCYFLMAFGLIIEFIDPIHPLTTNNCNILAHLCTLNYCNHSTKYSMSSFVVVW